MANRLGRVGAEVGLATFDATSRCDVITVPGVLGPEFGSVHRLAPLFTFALIFAACGASAAPATTLPPTTTSSTTTTSTTTTTTTTLPPTTTTTEPPPTTTLAHDPQFALLFDGFEQFGRLGDPAQPLIDAFIAAFGEATADSGWLADHGCSFDGPMRTITWIDPGFRLVFVDGVSDFGNGEHLVTYRTLLPIASPWRLFGLTRGMNVNGVGDLYPDGQLVDGPSLDYFQFDPEIPSYAWVFGSGEIRDFWAGTEYCG